MDSNHRPHAYQACALTTWAMRPYLIYHFWFISGVVIIGLSFLPYPFGGDEEDRTPDPLRARQVLSQLSYTPISGLRNANLLPFCFEGFKTFKIEQCLSRFTLEIWLEWNISVPTELYFKFWVLHRKEVIQPHLPIRLPCYDFTPVINPTFDSALLTVRLLASGVTDSHGVTGGVYKARERIHRSMLICDY